MRIANVLLAALVLLAAAGCSQQQAAERTAPPEAVSLAKKTVDDFRAQNSKGFVADLAPGLVTQMADKVLMAKMRAIFPQHRVAAVHVEGWWQTRYAGNVLGRDTGEKPGETVTRLTLRYEFEGGDAVRVNLLLASHDGALQVNQLNLVPLPAALIAENALTAHWTEGGGRQAFAVLALAVLVFILATAVKCLRTPGLRFKWLWFIVIWLSAIQVTMDWTSEKVFVKFLVLKFPPLWIDQPSPYDPAMVWFLLPLGAIVFRTWLKLHDEPAPAPRTFGE
jgi:hypothetical protein